MFVALGLLELQQVQPFYLEGGNDTNVACIIIPSLEYPLMDNNVAVWMNSAEEVVGSGRTLNLIAIRDNAGTYMCTVPTVPPISPVMFEVVIYCK